jgi:hypothetical protein
MIFGHLKCIQIPLEIYIRVSKSGLKKDRTTGPKITFLNRLVIIIKSGLHYQSFCDHSSNFDKVNSKLQ